MRKNSMPRVLPFLLLIACVRVSAATENEEPSSTGLPDSTVTMTIPDGGGPIVLQGIATVVFSQGAFESAHPVIVTATRDTRVRDHLAFTADMYSAVSPTDFALRVNTGDVAPANDVRITLVLSPEYLRSVPTEHTPELFLRKITGGAEEGHDYFRPHESNFDPVSHELIGWLRPHNFYDYSDTPHGEGTREALIIAVARP